MTKEEKAWLEMVEKVVDQLVEQYHYSKACVDVNPGDAFFNDSCKFVDLVSLLRQFGETLHGIIRFSELIEDKPER